VVACLTRSNVNGGSWRACFRDAQREVDVNIAGFLGFVMYNLGAFIGITHCFSMTSLDVVTLHTVLNILQNPVTI